MAFISRGANNFLKRIVVHGCARPWYVYVETFVPCFVQLVLFTSLVDAEDVMRMKAQRLAATPGKGPGRKKRWRGNVRLSTQPTKIQRYARSALQVLLVVTAPLEAIGYAWLMYSATDQFFFDWASLIEQSDFCEEPIESGPLIRRRDEGQIGILIACDAVPLPFLEQNRASWTTSAFGVDLPEGRFHANWAVTIQGPASGLNGVYLQLSVTSSVGDFAIKTEPVNIGPGEMADLVLNASFFITVGGGGHMGWEICGATVPAGIWCDKAIVTCQRVG